MEKTRTASTATDANNEIAITLPVSLRDWFAGQALIHLMPPEGWREGREDGPIADCTTQAYKVADAMLKAREASQ